MEEKEIVVKRILMKRMRYKEQLKKEYDHMQNEIGGTQRSFYRRKMTDIP